MKTTKTEVTTDIVASRRGPSNWEVLLIKRKKDPFAGKWALPGGFVNTDEEVTMAAVRELKEETGLEVQEKALRLIDYFDAPDRDPRGRVISFAFEVKADGEHSVKGADDAEEAQWFPIDDLPELAFDHQSILARCFEQ